MNILFITHDANYTGAPIALLRELEQLKRYNKKISFELLSLGDGSLMTKFRELCPVHKGWRDYNRLSSQLIKKCCKKRFEKPYLFLFKKGQFDVIYANSVVSFHAAIELKAKYGFPLIGHVHEAENWLYMAGIKTEQLNVFEKLIAVSELTSRNLIDLYNVPSEKIVIQHPISYWIDNYFRNKLIINPVSLLPNKFIIGVFCDGGWWKSTELIPFVMKNYYEKHPQSNCEFVIVGNIDKAIRYHLEYDLRKMNVCRQIHWVGGVNNPLDYHARFDLLLLLSREESYSLAAQEAAFMETPIIGFENVTGATEWISKGAGSLVPYMDFDRISEEIYNYYVDDKLRKDIGKKAKEIVTELYMKDSQMIEVIALLNSYSNHKCPKKTYKHP